MRARHAEDSPISDEIRRSNEIGMLPDTPGLSGAWGGRLLAEVGGGAMERVELPPASLLHAGLGLHVHAERRMPGFSLRAAFDVPPGLTVLFGPSGAGKSLTLQAIAGLVPLDRGRITLDGHVLADMTEGMALPPQRRRLGYVPQQYALFPHMSVAENVAYALPRPRHPWDRAAGAQRARRVAELLGLVRLTGFEARRPSELSGGQAQRVALARALAGRPRALLLDEPLGALDAPTRSAVQEDLRAVVLQSGVPAVVVTHDLAEARALGDRLVVLVNGRVVADGPVAEVLGSPPTVEVALLLGWRNVLPITRLSQAAGGARVEIEGGQVLHVAAPTVSFELDRAYWLEPAFQVGRGMRAALALHADRLEVAAAGQDSQDGLTAEHEPAAGDTDARQTLRGTLLDVRDAGAFCRLRVALAGRAPEGRQAPAVTVTCSPREWAALGVTQGDPVELHVAPVAMRLVAASAGCEPERSQEGGNAHTAPAVTSF